MVEAVVVETRAAVVSAVVGGQERNWVGTIASIFSFPWSPSAMVARRVESSSILRFNGFHPRAAIAFRLLNGRPNDFDHAEFIKMIISYGSMVSFICFFFFCFSNSFFALANSILYEPFCLLESPTCHSAVLYGTPMQTDHS